MDAAGSPLRGEGGVRYAYYTDAGEKVFREASDARVSSQSSFGVLEQPGCIALLVEQCFLTNEEDVRAFATESGCSAAAACYYRALRAFFDAL
ncbi:N-acetylmuramoyl-L-alanine amidase, partial [Ruminococcaceae bacterium OttesenSCG-928-O06]|nr:N-acetylmuramoyl-L-alanine amidase [Ruminococcaceae bacterium OttesenSCG-928-O06]